MERIIEPYVDDIVIHEYDLDIDNFLDSVNPFEEFIVNSWDADSEKVKITVSKDRIVIEDWGIGIENLKQFWEIGSQHKSSVKFTPKFKRKPIGWRGLGKLSFSKLGSKILVETKTKQTSQSSTGDLTKMKFSVKPLENSKESLSHIGTRVTISDLKNELSESEIIHFIKENLYGLILPIAEGKKHLKIFVNGKEVKPEIPPGSIKNAKYHFGKIQYLLYPSTVSKIDLLYRGVKICELKEKDLLAIGYVNIDWLNLIDEGCELAKNDEAKTFLSQVRKLIKQKTRLNYSE